VILDTVDTYLASQNYDPMINAYKVKASQSLQDWEKAGWIQAQGQLLVSPSFHLYDLYRLPCDILSRSSRLGRMVIPSPSPSLPFHPLLTTYHPLLSSGTFTSGSVAVRQTTPVRSLAGRARWVLEVDSRPHLPKRVRLSLSLSSLSSTDAC
jgi:hypothetical protein